MLVATDHPIKTQNMKYLLLTTLLLTAPLLTNCQSKKIDQRIFQPALLLLPPLTKVQTTEGVYLSNENEIERWYPAKKVEDLERRLSQF